jgi:hypothetical protein
MVLIANRFFRHSQLSSFRRQLNIYGFKRLTRGPDRGGYYHEMFLRGRPRLLNQVARTRIKGNGVKGAPSPSTEPNFYLMPYCLKIEEIHTFTETGDVLSTPARKSSKNDGVLAKPLPIAVTPLGASDRFTCDENTGASKLALNTRMSSFRADFERIIEPTPFFFNEDSLVEAHFNVLDQTSLDAYEKHARLRTFYVRSSLAGGPALRLLVPKEVNFNRYKTSITNKEEEVDATSSTSSTGWVKEYIDLWK